MLRIFSASSKSMPACPGFLAGPLLTFFAIPIDPELIFDR